jgi:trigger factor
MRMTDESRPEERQPETAATITEHSTEASAEKDLNTAGSITELPIEAVDEAQSEEEAKKLHQTVELRDVGPCKKHVKVTVDRHDIDVLLDKKYSEMVVDTPVAGFRPGKAPRKIIERRFHKEVTDQIRSEVLLQSLEQLAEEHDIAPLTAPDIDPTKIEIPKDGPLVYEFEVEVRPQFDLPNYKGLKLKRPVKKFSDEDVAREERRILAPYGSLVPKPEGNAQLGDYLVTDMTTRFGDRILSTHKEITVRVDPQLALKDGVATNFGAVMTGANGGDSRTIEITLSESAADAVLRGKAVQSTFDIKEIKSLRLPELTHDFLHTFGVHSEEQLREKIRVLLDKRLEYQQRQSARQQVLAQITAATSWDLPHDLLQRQARRALQRRVMEMQSAGMSEEEIRGRLRLLQQDVLRSTALALKEHFVLQKISEVEKIDIDEQDIDDAIERIAVQNDESPRRVRARLEKEDMMEALATEIIEAKALGLILESAEYADVPLEQEEGAVGTVETQAVPGEMHDPTAAAPEAEA